MESAHNLLAIVVVRSQTPDRYLTMATFVLNVMNAQSRPWETQKTFDVVIYFIKRYVGYFRNPPPPPCKVDKFVQGKLVCASVRNCGHVDSAIHRINHYPVDKY